MINRTMNVSIGGRSLKFDARPDRLDLRDLPYRPPVKNLPPAFPEDNTIQTYLSAYLASGLILDQGADGACTGFGLAAVVNYLLWYSSGMKTVESVSPHMLYHLAKFYDEWPGENYEGSSCRGALKGWHKHGVSTFSLWPSAPKSGISPLIGWDADAIKRPLGVYYRIDKGSVVDMQSAIYDTGAIYVSATVHKGWGIKKQSTPQNHVTLPVISLDRTASGGHAFALVGYNERGFVVQNSWGKGWGAGGFAILTYEDWVLNGTDAWVMALGVPVSVRASEGAKGGREALTSPRHFVFGKGAGERSAGIPGWFGGRTSKNVYAWSEEQAYFHTLVSENNGVLINRLPEMADAQAAAERICHVEPVKWHKSQGGNLLKLAIYAHGGLNSEDSSIERIRAMAPYFEREGVYPLFITWKSGVIETISGILDDQVASLFGTEVSKGFSEDMADAADRMFEGVCRNLLVRAMWSEMKENVGKSMGHGNGLDTLLQHLKALKKQLGDDLEIHLIGHSAGSFICGGVLQGMRKNKLNAKSCTLYAPACDLRFALDNYAPAMTGGTPVLDRNNFCIHVLSDVLELDDTVGPYQKSLLYLVSRALETLNKAPLLGLANSFDPACDLDACWHSQAQGDVIEWQKFFWGASSPVPGFATSGKSPGHGLSIIASPSVDTGVRMIKSSHGCFDNSVDIIGSTLRTIKGSPIQPIPNLDY